MLGHNSKACLMSTEEAGAPGNSPKGPEAGPAVSILLSTDSELLSESASSSGVKRASDLLWEELLSLILRRIRMSLQMKPGLAL